MSDIHKNYIGGEWTDGEGVSRNINPSDTDDVVGTLRSGERRPARRRRRRGARRLPRLVARDAARPP